MQQEQARMHADHQSAAWCYAATLPQIPAACGSNNDGCQCNPSEVSDRFTSLTWGMALAKHGNAQSWLAVNITDELRALRF
jgi:hypothetical protein